MFLPCLYCRPSIQAAGLLSQGVPAFGAIACLSNFTSGEKDVSRELPRLYATHDPQFRRVTGSPLGPALAGGNRVQELLNGEQIFPDMLQAICSAQHAISFETYIYGSGNIGREFADALSERARRQGACTARVGRQRQDR